MTLNELIRKAQALSFQLSSGDVPLVLEDEVLDDVTFEYINTDEGGPAVKISLW